MKPCNVFFICDILVERNCPPGSLAFHPLYGTVSVLSANGLHRRIRYWSKLSGGTNPRGRARVHVSTLVMHSPIRGLGTLSIRDWATIAKAQYRLD